jgi:hypothetical protein
MQKTKREKVIDIIMSGSSHFRIAMFFFYYYLRGKCHVGCSVIRAP